MALFGKKQKQTPPVNNDPLAFDPLTGESSLMPGQGDEPEAPAPKKRRLLGKSRRETQITRIEEVRRRLEAGELDNIDPDQVISLYMPHRRLRLLGDALLRLDRTRIALLLVLVIVLSLFILSFMQEKMGNFTINLDRLELFRKGISISEDGDFTQATARLVADTVIDATNISIEDLPYNLDEVEGSHNGRNYMAYTYYIRNAGKEAVDYVGSLKLDNCSKGAENAVRVVVYTDGERTVYAAPSATGEPEEGCVNFESDKIVTSYHVENFEVGDVHRYTVVIFMEGDDPECVDAIVGGSVQFSMSFDADGTDDRWLLWKFIEDVADTIRDNNPINAAGTVAPDFDNTGITWDTRKNQ